MYSMVALALLLVSPLVSIVSLHTTQWITYSFQLQAVLGAPYEYYDPYDVPREPTRGSGSSGNPQWETPIEEYIMALLDAARGAEPG